MVRSGLTVKTLLGNNRLSHDQQTLGWGNSGGVTLQFREVFERLAQYHHHKVEIP